MILRYPHYFESFRCIAAACPDSCCQEWDVLVDEASAEKYRALEGPLGEAIREKLCVDENGQAYFAITDRRCPMWQADGLCRIQAALSHDALCQTCRDFPRITHDFGDFQEKGLALSCPEAARLIFESPSDWKEIRVDGGEKGDYDTQDMELLLREREVMLTILRDSSLSVPSALTLALLYGYHAQAIFDGEEESAFDPAESLAFAAEFRKEADIGLLVEFYQTLEILTEDWPHRLADPKPVDGWSEALRTLAIYGMQRYFLQAISDFDIVGRVKMVIAGCLLVRHLGGNLPETAQKYAKEIENSAENVESILDGAYTSPALTDEKLLYWLSC